MCLRLHQFSSLAEPRLLHLLIAWLGIKKVIASQINKICGFVAMLYSKVLLDVEKSLYNDIYSIVMILAIRLVEY
jgi:hypothetical protein